MHAAPERARTALGALGAALALASCAPTSSPAPSPAADPGPSAEPLPGVCDAGAAQGMVGEIARPEMSQRLLAATGARQLRWAPPRSMLTMDYRSDRLTVEYDDGMVITRIACG